MAKEKAASLNSRRGGLVSSRTVEERKPIPAARLRAFDAKLESVKKQAEELRLFIQEIGRK